jgi:hypothetical protein
VLGIILIHTPRYVCHYEGSFTELVLLLRDKIWDDDGSKKLNFVQNTQIIGSVDAIFEELVRNKSFSESCNFLRSHAVPHDNQNKEKATRQVNAITKRI